MNCIAPYWVKHRRALFTFVETMGLLLFTTSPSVAQQITFLKNVSVIDGTGLPAQRGKNIVIHEDRIVSIGDAKQAVPKGATVLDLSGKTIMPEMTNTHGHLGILKGTTMSSANYTEDNIRHQLLRYQSYGVGAMVSLGTDHDEIFALREQSHEGKIPGAIIYTAGFGFGAKNGVPPVSMGMDHVFRPTTPQEARTELDELVPKKPDLVKIWVDDFWGQYPKMPPEIYAVIIDEAHKKHLRVAAHVYHLEDARRLVNLHLDIIAHSVRDAEIDDALLAQMKKQNVVYIPTLSLDEFACAYQNDPPWLNDPFFQASLEPDVLQMITSPEYKTKLRANPVTQQEMAAAPIALKNLKRVYDAGVLVSMGTDSGASPLRAQGFAEHMELELIVRAGLTPLEAITVATRNPAIVLRVDKDYGTLEPGKKANFIVLAKDPSKNIANTDTIVAVWKDGKKVSDGPLADKQ
jgi:imidazolonepropionase-like amidohydrolase